MKSIRPPSFYYYRPRRSWGKVMFLHVCDSVHKGGGCYPSMHCRWYPSMPCSRSPGRGVPGPRGVCSWGVPGTATAVGGTHPSGMHSCMTYFYRAEGGGHGHLAPWIRYCVTSVVTFLSSSG